MPWSEIGAFIRQIYEAGGPPIRWVIWFWAAFLFLYGFLAWYEHVNDLHPKRARKKQNYYHSLLFFGIFSFVLEYATLFGWFPEMWRFPEGWIRGLEPTGFIVLAGGLALVILGRIYLNGQWGPDLYEYPSGSVPALVTKGIYKTSRHPIYFGQSCMAIGTSFAVNMPIILAAAIALLAVNIFRARREDQHLLAQHGQAWQDYADKVSFFVPFPSK